MDQKAVYTLGSQASEVSSSETGDIWSLAWIESITEKFFVIEVEYFTEGLFHSSSVEIIGAQVL